MAKDYLFTSESVSEGHPDKVADQISDAILDAILEQDPSARVAAETLCNTGLVVLAGEITTTANIDYISVARDTIKRIGYDNNDYGIDHRGCAVLVGYDKQSPDIAQGVDEGRGLDLDQGAGDQGLMFGYACDETPELMPAAIYYAHRLVERQSQLRKDGRIPWLRPDAKSQVTLRYVDGKPVSAETIVLSTQHAPEIEHRQIEEAVIEEIIKDSDMEIPEAMIETQQRQMIDEFAQRIQMQGLTLEQYFQFTGASYDQMIEQVKPQAEKRIQSRLVLEAVAAAEKIEATEEDYEEELKSMAEAYQMEVDKVKELLPEKSVQQIKEDIAVKKAAEFVVDNAKEK